MKNIDKEVRSDKAVIGVVQIPVYESLKEMVAAMKEPAVLALANRQNASAKGIPHGLQRRNVLSALHPHIVAFRHPN